MRPCCENCGKDLPNDSAEAMICTYECTFCLNCVEHILENVCPNCGGGFEKRPTRPKEGLTRYPMKSEKYVRPVERNRFLDDFRYIDPRKRWSAYFLCNQNSSITGWYSAVRSSWGSPWSEHLCFFFFFWYQINSAQLIIYSHHILQKSSIFCSKSSVFNATL